ncbi:MAG: penicillin acylase family protein [Microscillaceae bacterium]|jgi:penicillin amidase|nr:penicillin acylase family protein [Microscillaceae bacterium]
MKFLRLLFSLGFTFTLFWVLNNRFADLPVLGNNPKLQAIPALGKFLNPFGGFWVNAEPAEIPKDIRIKTDKLKDKVEIVLDDRLVPHIFAKNEYDVYFAQGYVTAKYRLWQMEFVTHAAAGRLSEILGERLLSYDKHQRRIGMMLAAERAVEAMSKDTTSKNIVDAYTAGVNAYIEQLTPRDYPLEYKLLGYTPEPWTPIKCALLLKYMAQDLSYRGDDLAMTNVLTKYGKEVIKELFSGYPPTQDPIIPPQTVFEFKKEPIPKTPKQTTAPLPLGSEKGKFTEERKGIGSNNWAISGIKTQSGLPILANDPHLTLNLPSIWFEIQMVAPKLNVYGSSIPGAPGVIIGFNQDVSWGVTNVESDVQDWYYLQFKDNSFGEYFHDKQWKKTQTRVETIKIRDGKTVQDTMYLTHHGPLVVKPNEAIFAKEHNLPLNCALRWVAHEPSNELMTFYKLNRAKNYEDYRKAITTYVCPAQNFVFADNKGDIAITPNGKFPLKWKEQGKFILDGSNPEHDWQGWIPTNQNPHTKNPERGFVSSANQFPVDTLYPYYLHWEFATYERGKRINERLAAMEKATPQDLQGLQNDNVNLLARDLVPTMLKYLKTNELSGNAKLAFQALEKWNYRFQAQTTAPTIFKLWINNVVNGIWQDQFGEEGLRYPGLDKTRDMILANDSLKSAKWFDDIKTPQKEDLAIILNQSFKAMADTLSKKLGKFENWQWANFRKTSIQHLTRVPQFSVNELVTDGDPRTVNAIGPRNGPSWRMVVALGKTPKALCIYPGGQSGNPGSHYYSNFINQWQKGELAEAIYMKSANENSQRIAGRIRMNVN